MVRVRLGHDCQREHFIFCCEISLVAPLHVSEGLGGPKQKPGARRMNRILKESKHTPTGGKSYTMMGGVPTDEGDAGTEREVSKEELV